MRRTTLFLCAPLACLTLAGCAVGDAADAPVVPAPQWTDVVTIQSTPMLADWGLAVSTCQPVVGGTFVAGAPGHARLELPANLTSASVEFTWTAENPTAEDLLFYFVEGNHLRGFVEGRSPLVLEMAPESVAEMEGGAELEVLVQPARCPTLPANAAASVAGQAIDVKGTYGHRMVADATGDPSPATT